MDRYLIKKPRLDHEHYSPISNVENTSNTSPGGFESQEPTSFQTFSDDIIIGDPAKRPKFSEYNVNIQDQVRRAYLLQGPCQPRGHDFPTKMYGKVARRFVVSWFDKYNWLEYSVINEKAYCLPCFLFKQVSDQGGGDVFVTEGFSNWKKKERLDTHIGEPNKRSMHKDAVMKCKDLMDGKGHIEVAFVKQSSEAREHYLTRLNASIDVVRLLLHQGLPFRGHREAENSDNQGNFLETLKFLGDHNEEIKKVTLKNAPKNCKATSPPTQKEIVSVIGSEIRDVIIDEMKNELFSLLVDESRDCSLKEQMAVVLRYVNKKGQIIERFFAIVHVTNTSALSLKAALDDLFSNHGLSFSSLRGQGYDGASNMQGEFNGLKSMILQGNKSAFYVHCFAHQLQLTLIVVAKKDVHIAMFFTLLSKVVNIVGSSCKRADLVREAQRENLLKKLESGDLVTGRGLNQETSIKRAGDTRWGSHYDSIQSLILLFSPVMSVIDFVSTDGSSAEQKGEAYALLKSVNTFEFAFNLHLMKTILGITFDLSQALQKKDQNIVNAMKLVSISKQRFQTLRDQGWEKLLSEVTGFCHIQEISTSNMDEQYVTFGKSRRSLATNLHHFRVELFYAVIDLQVLELNDRFNEVNTQLLISMACLDPSDKFSSFDKMKLIEFAKLYPSDFSSLQLMKLDDQLESYILDMQSSSEFSNLVGIGELAIRLVELKKDITYPLAFLLVKLALLLPVATTSVERAFSAMNIVKTRLRNRMGDEWMGDNLLAYIERGLLKTISNEAIVQRYQKMKTRRIET